MIYKDLIVWQKSDEFALAVYQVTKTFPREEIYGITSQLRWAALSVPTNIAEGYSRKGDKELARFVGIAVGSLAETEYLLGFSHRRGYLNGKEYAMVEESRNEAGRLLWSFYRKVSK